MAADKQVAQIVRDHVVTEAKADVAQAPTVQARQTTAADVGGAELSDKDLDDRIAKMIASGR